MFDVCKECAPGCHAMDEGSAACDACPKGQFSPSPGWGEDCLYCLVGNVTNANQTGCEPCRAGRYWADFDACDLCPEGTWNPKTGGTILDCTTCPSAAARADRTACLCDPDATSPRHACPGGWTCPSAAAGAGMVDCVPAL